MERTVVLYHKNKYEGSIFVLPYHIILYIVHY